MNEKSKSSKLNNRIISGTMFRQDQKNPVTKIDNKTQSKISAEQSDPEMLDAFLNSVNPSFKSGKGGRVITAVVARTRYQIATKNQTHQRLEHSAGSHSSITVIKVLLDSGSDGDLMFHEKGTPMHFHYLTRHVPTSYFLVYVEWELPR